MLFAGDRSIENFEQLFEQVKQYLKLQKEYSLIKLTSKLSVLLSTLFLVVVFLILGMAALFYLLMALAYAIQPMVGSLGWSYAIIGGIALLLLALIAAFRQKLIIKPTVNFLAHLFLDDDEDAPKEDAKAEIGGKEREEEQA
jgi:sterol desaturase/sphingolipid hydroxylase (fatty acid hydroxylase superfamily)